MIPGRRYGLFDWLLGIWRRRLIVLVAFVVVTTAGIVAARSRPYRYRAEALILADFRSVAPEYVRASVTTETMSQRLPSIKQQIISRPRLEEIINELNLYPKLREVRPMDAVLEQMSSSDIRVSSVEGSQSFRVSYDSTDPDLAYRVTERLVRPFIEERSRDRAALAHETSAFLEDQLEQARKRLVEQEKRLEAYRLRHGTQLPTHLPSNIQVIQNTQTQLQSITESINRDRDRRLLASRLLADLQPEPTLPDGVTDPDAAVETPVKSAVVLQLEAAQAELKAFEARLTPEHPDVRRTKRLIEDLQAQAKREAAAAAAAAARKPPSPTEIAKRNRISELRAEIESLDRQIADRRTTEERLKEDLLTYQARVDALPVRESELASLTRDYDTIQTLYRNLLAKREESKISENLEEQQVGGQFRIIDPPRRPETPLGPARRLIYLGGAAAGLVLGFGVALLLQLLDRRLRTAADVHAALDLPVVATIPLIPTVAERRQAFRRSLSVSVALAGLFVLCATVVWLSFQI
jgi:polysaccharide chain length determinant protein (PEP-CTERM system associated)